MSTPPLCQKNKGCFKSHSPPSSLQRQRAQNKRSGSESWHTTSLWWYLTVCQISDRSDKNSRKYLKSKSIAVLNCRFLKIIWKCFLSTEAWFVFALIDFLDSPSNRPRSQLSKNNYSFASSDQAGWSKRAVNIVLPKMLQLGNQNTKMLHLGNN